MRCATTDLQHGRWKVGHWVMRQNFQMILVCVHLGEWKFQFQDCCRNLSILLHVDHLFWTFFCHFGWFAAILRRGNLIFRIAIKIVQYYLGTYIIYCKHFFVILGCLPQSWRGEEIGVGAPPTIISLWWQLLLLCRKASHLPLPPQWPPSSWSLSSASLL